MRSWLVCRSFKQDIDKNICTLTMSSVGHRHTAIPGLGLPGTCPVYSHSTASAGRPDNQHKTARESDPTTIDGTDLSVRCSARPDSLGTVAVTVLSRRMVAVCRLGAPFLTASGHCDGKSSLHTKNGRVQRLAAGLPEDFKSIRDDSGAACRLLPRSSTAHCIIVPAAN